MAWVTWRQHRLQLLVGLGVLAAIGLAAAATGFGIRSAYERQELASCVPPATRLARYRSRGMALKIPAKWRRSPRRCYDSRP